MQHGTVKKINLAAITVLLLVLLVPSRAYLPMYEPGAPVVLQDPYDAYGVPTLCDNAESVYPEIMSCYRSDNETPDACENIPEIVSRTPIINSGPRVNTTTPLRYIAITCGLGADKFAADLAYTLNGTFPDIYQAVPSADLANGNILRIDHHRNYPDLFVVARCIEDGKLPSRIAYFRRLANNTGDCYNYNRRFNYRQLDLPQCYPDLVGANACDGQTIVEHPPVPTPPPAPVYKPPTRPTPTPITSDDPCYAARDAYYACQEPYLGLSDATERATGMCGCAATVLANDEICAYQTGVCRGSGVSYDICSVAQQAVQLAENYFDVTCVAGAGASGTRVASMFVVWLMLVLVLQ